MGCIGAGYPDAAFFLADEQPAVAVIHHAAFRLAGQLQLAQALCAKHAAGQGDAEMQVTPVLVVDKGFQPALRRLVQANAIHFVQPGRDAGQLADAAAAVDAEQQQRVVVAPGGQRQIMLLPVQHHPLAQVDVVDAPDLQQLLLPALQIVGQQPLLFIGAEHA